MRINHNLLFAIKSLNVALEVKFLWVEYERDHESHDFQLSISICGYFGYIHSLIL